MKIAIIALTLLLLCANIAFGQSDSSVVRFRPRDLIAPVALIALGSTVFIFPEVQNMNTSIRDHVVENGYRKTGIEDYTQFAPLVAVYGLNLCGVRGKHNYRDLAMITATAAVLTLGVTYGGKAVISSLRPDGSTYTSFPSGHTSNAFMGAHILFQEYKHLSPWYGIGGYTVAALTGLMRITSNRHWMTDVLAGAGVGILCAQAAYWIYPSMQRWLFPNTKTRKTESMPLRCLSTTEDKWV